MACVPIEEEYHEVALSRSASVFAVGDSHEVRLYDWRGEALRSVDVDGDIDDMHFTPCGKYLVVNVFSRRSSKLQQYDVATLSCVHVLTEIGRIGFVISPCSRVVVFPSNNRKNIVTRHLYPE